jgi:hypothetical protein
MLQAVAKDNRNFALDAGLRVYATTVYPLLQNSAAHPEPMTPVPTMATLFTGQGGGFIVDIYCKAECVRKCSNT